MKVLGNLPVVKDTNSKYPFDGAIQNETDTVDGTPVVREIYNDILMNLYKLLEITNVNPTNEEDSNDTQYQIIDALKKLANNYNDIEQVLTLSGSEWKVPLELGILPNKYVFFARPTEDYVSGTVYTFKGSDAPSYSLTSQTGFNSGDEVLVIIDSSTVRVYSLTRINQLTEVFTVFGQPIAFNDSTTMYYQEGGNILTDAPSIGYLENVIRVNSGDGTLIVNDIFVLKGKAVCVVFDPTNTTYLFYSFNLNDFNNTVKINFLSYPVAIGVDNNPYFYSNGEGFYITNDAGNSNNDSELTYYSFDENALTLSYVASFALDISFQKTTNAVIKNNDLFTLIAGTFNKFSLTGSTVTNIAVYNGVIGNLFAYAGGYYYTSGEVAKKWEL